MLQFYSPSVNGSLDAQSLRTTLLLDNSQEDLANFEYHPDPSFNELAKNVITETSIIIVTVRTGPVWVLIFVFFFFSFSFSTLRFALGLRICPANSVAVALSVRVEASPRR